MEHTAYLVAAARASQLWLLALSLYALVRSIWLSPALNRLRFVSDNVYFAYALIMLLSLAQVYQCGVALASRVGELWWMPLVCKQMSLAVYLTILECVAGCGGKK